MKYSTKELMKMGFKKVWNICNGDCDTSKCPFKKILQRYREDSFCIIETNKYVDAWIKSDEVEIKDCQHRLKRAKDRIKRYKKFKQLLEEELNEK